MMRRTLVTSLLLLAALVGTGVIIAAGSSEPERPPWADAQGRLVPEDAPTYIEVAGPDGAPVVCSNGQRLKVPRSRVFGPPTQTPARAMLQQRNGKQDLVWRCGTGSRPHLNPRLVPESEDPLDSDG